MSELLTYSEIEKILGEHKYTKNCVLVARRHQSRQNISAQLIASRYAVSVGLTFTGSAWQVLSPNTTVKRLSGMLHKTSAYQHKLLPKMLAYQAASSFVGLFDRGDAYCLEGLGFEKNFAAIAWAKELYPTTDEAIVVFDDTHIGLIYVEENY